MHNLTWIKPMLILLDITNTQGGKTEPLGDGDGGEFS
jgi:hypothetical protein